MASTSPLKKYTTWIVVAVVMLGIASSFGREYWPNIVHPLWFIELLVIAGLQWLMFAFVQKFAQHKLKTLLRQYQIAKFTKLVIFIILLGIYVFVIKDFAMQVLIDFLVYYLIFFVLEIWFFHHWMVSLNRSETKTE
jgi:hypothetical protein